MKLLKITSSQEVILRRSNNNKDDLSEMPSGRYETDPGGPVETIRQGFARLYEDNPRERVIYFKDFVSGGHLERTRTKTCITEQDPMCAQGLLALERLGRTHVDIKFLFGYHSAPRDFFDVLDNPAARDILERALCVAIEANGNGGGVMLEPEGTGRGMFQRAQISWLQARDKLILPCDIDTPEDPRESGGELRRSMLEILKLQDLVDGSPHIDAPEKTRLLSIGTLYYHLVREEMMLGQLGYWLQELERRDALDTNEKTIVPFMVGSFHRTALAEKAAMYLGVQPEVHDTRPATQSAALFAQIARQDHATYQQVNTFGKTLRAG